MIDSGIVQASLVKPGIVGAGLVSPYSRYFNFFDGVQEYVQLAQPVTFSGDFDFEALVAIESGFAGSAKIADNNTDGIGRLDLQWSGFNQGFELDARDYGTWVVDGVETTSLPADGKLHLVRFFRRSSNPDQSSRTVGRLGIRATDQTSPFPGIIANVSITDNGTLIHNWSIDDNSNVISDSVGSNNGTLVNPSGGWGLFDKQSDGDYLGQELITQQVWESPAFVESQWSFSNDKWTLTGDGSSSVLNLLPTAENPDIFRISGSVASITGPGTGLTAVQDNTATVLISTSGAYSFDIDTSIHTRQQYKRQAGVVVATIDKPSMKQLLRVA